MHKIIVKKLTVSWMPVGVGLTYTDTHGSGATFLSYIMMNIWMTCFLIACNLTVGQNWPYFQYFWRNSICLLIWPAASGVCKFSPASSLVEVSLVCLEDGDLLQDPHGGENPLTISLAGIPIIKMMSIYTASNSEQRGGIHSVA